MGKYIVNLKRSKTKMGNKCCTPGYDEYQGVKVPKGGAGKMPKNMEGPSDADRYSDANIKDNQ